LVGAGRDIINGVKNGILGAISGAVAAARNAAKQIVDGFKSALKIGSPSKVMADEVGRWIPAGIGDGITDNMDIAGRSLMKGLDQQLDTIRGKFGTISLSTPGVTGSDGASLGAITRPAGVGTGGVTVGSIQVVLNGPTAGDPRETGDMIALAIVDRLSAASLARGGR
jgi:phage-related protein